MFKIDKLMRQGLTIPDNASSNTQKARNEGAKPPENASVVISDEGKKKYILGQLMSRISSNGNDKK